MPRFGLGMLMFWPTQAQRNKPDTAGAMDVGTEDCRDSDFLVPPDQVAAGESRSLGDSLANPATWVDACSELTASQSGLIAQGSYTSSVNRFANGTRETRRSARHGPQVRVPVSETRRHTGVMTRVCPMTHNPATAARFGSYREHGP